MDNLKKLSDDLGTKAKIGAAVIGTKVAPLKEKAEAAIAGAMKKEDGEPSGIAEILRKAKEKVVGGSSATEERAASEASSTAPTNQELEDLRDDVESIVSEIESTSEKEHPKEKIQKLLLPLLTKLKVAQDKFQAMMEERQKRKEAAEPTEQTSSSPVKNLLVQAEAAARLAFENAEKVARKVAQKAGIFDDGTKTTTNDAAETDDAATTEPAAEDEPKS